MNQSTSNLPSINLSNLTLPLLEITSPSSSSNSSHQILNNPIISPNSQSNSINSLSQSHNSSSSNHSIDQQPIITQSPSSNSNHHQRFGHPGGVKLPPGLAAKMAAMTKRKENPPSSLDPNQRLDPSAFIGNRPSLSTNPSCSNNSVQSLKPSVSLRRQKPIMKLGDLNSSSNHQSLDQNKFLSVNGQHSTPFENFSKIVDPSGRLNFGGKAIVHSNGVNFSNGSSFSINMDELTLLEELGKGNYGTVQKVFHKPTKVIMAMKEIRLELDHSKLKAILTELDILHRATSDTIVEFYGAFFIESCVYYCMEYMDGGSLDKLAGADVPEPVLASVTTKIVEGLRFLKDELQTIHRDVKPTNILINRRGQTKLCDFGVSGQLERSLAKTNIGCQSYMAPERIQGERSGEIKSYTVSSDVWSLGLSIVEFAIGHYPYPPETYSNIFAQLNEIVHGQSPELPNQIYSESARDFVRQCLRKDPKERPTYNELLEHPFLINSTENNVDMIEWVANALEQVQSKKSNTS
ncbi:hypothetical protein O181_083441 [Austropuccinia psidii MF-1]|uniref:mitogen-activated protein kinase kinase n=1 Tax=Austropuccinia psidii MF-1 TaxID=1389203 RepID=A0A9Q3FUK7_9BASI|nr:hypothetical protein [Austropuccinia psidii MF-1]